MVQEETMSVAHTPVEKTVEAKKDTSNVKSQEIAPEKNCKVWLQLKLLLL